MRTRLKTLAKDHLQQAFYILDGDKSFADVQRLIARTLDAIERDSEAAFPPAELTANVLRFRPLDRPISLPPHAKSRLRRRGGATEG